MLGPGRCHRVIPGPKPLLRFPRQFSLPAACIRSKYGPSANEKAANHANYDESLANPFPNIPDPLVMNDGRKVTTPGMWWDQRRPELLEMYSKFVYGRVPGNVPKVTWTVATVDRERTPFQLPQLNENGDPPNTWQLVAAGWGFYRSLQLVPQPNFLRSNSFAPYNLQEGKRGVFP
jgi:hypothetical protein